MIRLEAFVEDNKIAKVLHALNGLVVQMSVGPVHNAKAGKGGVVGAGLPITGVDMVNSVIRKALTAKKNTFHVKDITTQCEEYGIPKNRVHAALNKLGKTGAIKRKSNGNYQINVPRKEKK